MHLRIRFAIQPMLKILFGINKVDYGGSVLAVVEGANLEPSSMIFDAIEAA